MIRVMILGCAIVLLSSEGAVANPSDKAREAAEALAEAATRLTEASSAENRIGALTVTVQAYEAGLAALREGMRDAALEERAIREDFDREAGRLSSLLGTLTAIEAQPEDLTLVHPDGILARARAGMLLSDVAPAIAAEVRALKAPLDELAELSVLRASARATLEEGLEGILKARADLGQAISDRTRPEVSPTDSATLQAIVNSADSLEGFAATLATVSEAPDESAGFGSEIGALPMPVAGKIITGYRQPDPSGRTRPGIQIAAPPFAVVTAPHLASVRYAGPLLDLGLVVVLEPAAGYLLVLSGLGELFVAPGEVLDQNAPVGLMGGNTPQSEQKLINSGEESGQGWTETLYIELHKGDATLDPVDWFVPAED